MQKQLTPHKNPHKNLRKNPHKNPWKSGYNWISTKHEVDVNVSAQKNSILTLIL